MTVDVAVPEKGIKVAVKSGTLGHLHDNGIRSDPGLRTTARWRVAATGKQVTDYYLLGLARRNGGRLVTFDRALATAGGDDVICLLPD